MDLPIDQPNFRAAVYVSLRAENFLPSIRTLQESGATVVVGTPAPELIGTIEGFGVRCINSLSFASFLNDVFDDTTVESVLAVSDAVLVPKEGLGSALAATRKDPRIASISFLSNSARFLSFPQSDQPVLNLPEGHDQDSVTKRLRSLAPRPRLVPIPLSAGPAVLINSSAVGCAGRFKQAPSGSTEATVVEFCMRASDKGFIHLADLGTFYARPSDLTVELPERKHERDLPPDDVEWLQENHRLAGAALSRGTAAEDPLRLEYQSAKTKIRGLSLTVDGTCLGPQEMGTQVTTLSLIRALAARKEVVSIGVPLAGAIPSYAASSLADPKITAEVYNPERGWPHQSDVMHRPFQPDANFDITAWRRSAERVVVSVLDLIAYRIGNYHECGSDWEAYRSCFRRVLGLADGVVGISNDVRDQAELERLPIDFNRFFVVQPGTDHLAGAQELRMPDQLRERGLDADQFIVSLGANYSHKNRELALKATQELRNRGSDLRLILVGTFVPFGSSRVAEAKAQLEGESCLVLPDVGYRERNWLLKHASAVLYPTSAEGFGFVPYEAAHFGTPTVYVGFGPLAEIGGKLPVEPTDWRPESLATAVEQLVRDPVLAKDQVHALLAAGANFTWARAAEDLLEVYRGLLACPPTWSI